MTNNGNNPFRSSSEETFDLSKEELLSKVSQEEIFKKFLGIEPITGRKFKAPRILRIDKHPTCTFKYFRGRLLYRDWRESKPYDCFEIVRRLNSCGFVDAMKIISNEFGITRVNGIKRNNPPLLNLKESSKKTYSYSDIRVKRQDFTNEDREYLKAHGLERKDVEFFGCSGVGRAWLNGRLIYQSIPGDPALLYHFGGYNYKIYFYKRDYKRFMCNTSALQGYRQLPSTGDLLIITKSMKDVMVFRKAGIYAVAPQSESEYIRESLMRELKSRFSGIYTLFDFDHTGVKSANFHRKEYGIPPLFFTDGRFNTPDLEAKDPAEYSFNFGIKKLKELIRQKQYEIKKESC